jgi:short-subunit dehydrogenase
MEFRAAYGPWALVTGASSGIGAALARALARRGLDLALAARRADRLEALAQDLRRERRVETRVVAVDLSEPAGPQTLCERVADLDLGLVVNNAGRGWQGSFLEQDPEQLTRMLRLNCEAAALVARLLLPRLVARRRGGMILTASLAGFQPAPWVSAYGASKGFDLLLGEALAVELRGTGVDLLTLAPGHTRSEFHEVAGVRGPAIGGRDEPERLVAAALARLGHRELHVPGWRHRALLAAQRLAPRSWIRTVSGALLRRRMERGAGDAGAS